MFLLGLLIASGAQTARDFIIESNSREVARTTSPDSRVDAVFVDARLPWLGASSALYLVPKDEPAPAWGPVLRANGIEKTPKLNWKNPQLIEIEYQSGCIETFSNFWHSNDVEHGNFYIEILLNSPVGQPCVGNRVSMVSPERAR
jgi:hypothetical protein